MTEGDLLVTSALMAYYDEKGSRMTERVYGLGSNLWNRGRWGASTILKEGARGGTL